METKRAIEIIQRLADGVSPYTGEIMENDSVFQNPETVRALYTAMELMKHQESRKERQRSAPGNTGNAWTTEEDARLVDEYDRGMDITTIAKTHERTSWAIQSRLLKLGKIRGSYVKDDVSR